MRPIPSAKTYSGFRSPSGVLYQDITNLRQFCKLHRLRPGCMCQVASGKRHSHKGWTYYPTRTAPQRKGRGPNISYTGFVSPEDGKVYHVTTTLQEFCKEHGLTISNMSNVNTGTLASHKGWRKHIPS